MEIVMGVNMLMIKIFLVGTNQNNENIVFFNEKFYGICLWDISDFINKKLVEVIDKVSKDFDQEEIEKYNLFFNNGIFYGDEEVLNNFTYELFNSTLLKMSRVGAKIDFDTYI